MIERYPEFQLNIPAESAVLAQIGSVFHIPQDYETFLKASNGGFGFIGEEYVIFTKAEELIATNAHYHVQDLFPGIMLIGNNGASEAIAIDLRPERTRYILIPFLFEDEAIIELGDTFNEMIDKIGSKGYFG